MGNTVSSNSDSSDKSSRESSYKSKIPAKKTTKWTDSINERRQMDGVLLVPQANSSSIFTYSSTRKNYERNRVLGFDTNFSSFATTDELLLPNIAQTDAQEVLVSFTGARRLGSYKSVGIVLNSNNDAIGSCVLLPNARILSCRHVFEGNGDIRHMKAVFGYFTASDECIAIGMQAIQEEDLELDYAIIQLSDSPRIAPMEFNTNITTASLALLHYPLGKPLQCSVERRDDSNLYSLRFVVYHDSDFCSSGGAYVGNDGKCCAIHLGCEKESNGILSFNLSRYAVEISRIQEKQPDSLLFLPNKTVLTSLTELSSVKRGYEDEKNAKSKKRHELKENNRSISGSIARTSVRLEIHDPIEYQVYSVRDLATRFPELGLSIVSNVEHTHTNKTKFINSITGWYVCYDKYGNYNTVIDNFGNHVALDGEKSRDGKGDKFHFRNSDTLSRANSCFNR